MSEADGNNDEHSVVDAQGGKGPVRYALYMRTAAGDADAIQVQRERLLAHVKAQPGAWVVVMLAEFGNGMDLERDGLADLFRWVERRDVDAVLVTDLARLALGVPQQLHVLLKLATTGVRLEFVTGPDTVCEGDALTLDAIKEAFEEFEREMRAARAREAEVAS